MRQGVLTTLGADMSTLAVKGSWANIFRESTKADLEAILPDFLRARRWFGGKARRIHAVEILEAIPIHQTTGSLTGVLGLVRVEYVEGKPERYVLPFAFAVGERAFHIQDTVPQMIIARVRVNGDQEEGLLFDALWDSNFSTALLDAIVHSRQFTGAQGEIIAFPTQALWQLLPSPETPLQSAIMQAEQSNTSVVYGHRLILKLFRRMEEGVNPDLEIGRFLTERGFAHIPPVAGALEYHRTKSEPVTLAILQGFVPNQGDAWRHTLDTLGCYFNRVLAEQPTREAIHPPRMSLLALSEEALPPPAIQCIGPYLDEVRLLGKRTGEMHVTLAQEVEDSNFTPEPFSNVSRRILSESMIIVADQAFRLLRQHLTDLPEPVQGEAQRVLDLEGEVRRRLRLIRDQQMTAIRIRCHGDYHLGQVLYTGKDFVIIDFEGEPARSLSERREKGSPLRDVSGMLRSFHYAAYAALLLGKAAGVRPEDFSSLERSARFWYLWVSAAFLKAYLTVVARAAFLPSTREELHMLLEAYLLEKAVYELVYELNNRPDWVKIPLQGILQLVGEAG